jgi:ectoine hydroxylase-related dioxygenase (phytanoyl-CoA dioxygenase family)
MPDIEGDRKSYDILSWDLQPGDCIVFHALTVHGAPGNPSQQRGRRALSTFWMGDDATYAKRPGMVRPAFHGHGLKPGAPMECDYFPRVWPRTDETRVLKSARFTDPGFTVSV